MVLLRSTIRHDMMISSVRSRDAVLMSSMLAGGPFANTSGGCVAAGRKRAIGVLSVSAPS